MEPSIGRSLREGFRVSNSSWVGMACYAGAWIPVMIFLVIGLLMTNPPEELFEEAQQPAEQSVPAETVTGETTPAAANPAAAQPDLEVARQRDRVIGQWFSRAWFVLFLLGAFAVAAGAWIAAGQIGFLHKKMEGGVAGVSDFWKTAAARFGPMVASSALAFLMALGGLLVFGLATLVFAALARALPEGLLVFAGLVLILVSAMALFWLGVRLALWFIVVVVDRLGPLGGLKASFHATRTRWWALFGLFLVFGAINFGVWLSFLVLMVVLSFLGSLLVAVFAIIAFIGYLFLTQVYIAFALTGATLRFYLDVKGASASTQAAAS